MQKLSRQERARSRTKEGRRPWIKVNETTKQLFDGLTVAASAYAEWNDKIRLDFTIRDTRNLFKKLTKDGHDENNVETLACGLRAAVFAAGLGHLTDFQEYDTHEHDHDLDDYDERQEMQEEPDNCVTTLKWLRQRLEQTRLYVIEHAYKMEMSAAGGNLFRHAFQGVIPCVASIMNAFCDTTYTVIEWALLIDDNRRMDRIFKSTNILLENKSYMSPKLLWSPKAMNALQSGLTGIIAVMIFIVDIVCDYTLVPIPLVSISLQIITLSIYMAAEILRNSARIYQMNQIARKIDQNIPAQKSLAKNFAAGCNDIGYIFTSFLGIGAAIMTIFNYIFRFTNYAANEEERNRESSLQTASCSVELGYQIGLENKAARILIEQEWRLAFATYSDIPERGRMPVKAYLFKLRVANMARNPAFESKDQKTIESLACENLDKEICAVKATIREPNTTTPFQDIKRVMIQMAEHGKLKNDYDKSAFIASVKAAKISQNTINPYKELQAILNDNFYCGEGASFLMSVTTTDPFKYSDAEYQLCARGVLMGLDAPDEEKLCEETINSLGKSAESGLSEDLMET